MCTLQFVRLKQFQVAIVLINKALTLLSTGNKSSRTADFAHKSVSVLGETFRLVQYTFREETVLNCTSCCGILIRDWVRVAFVYANEDSLCHPYGRLQPVSVPTLLIPLVRAS